MPFDVLHTYRCARCQTVATSTVRYTYEDRLVCNMCHSYMRFLCTDPITTPERRALAERGLVFNPGVDVQCMPGDGSGRR